MATISRKHKAEGCLRRIVTVNHTDVDLLIVGPVGRAIESEYVE